MVGRILAKSKSSKTSSWYVFFIGCKGLERYVHGHGLNIDGDDWKIAMLREYIPDQKIVYMKRLNKNGLK